MVSAPFCILRQCLGLHHHCLFPCKLQLITLWYTQNCSLYSLVPCNHSVRQAAYTSQRLLLCRRRCAGTESHRCLLTSFVSIWNAKELLALMLLNGVVIPSRLERISSVLVFYSRALFLFNLGGWTLISRFLKKDPSSSHLSVTIGLDSCILYRMQLSSPILTERSF